MNKLSALQYKVAKALRGHEAFIVSVVALLVLFLLTLRINSLNNLPMDQAYYDQKTSELKSVTFNQDAIDQIESLRDSNVADPGVQLPSGRDNPFVE